MLEVIWDSEPTAVPGPVLQLVAEECLSDRGQPSLDDAKAGVEFGGVHVELDGRCQAKEEGEGIPRRFPLGLPGTAKTPSGQSRRSILKQHVRPTPGEQGDSIARPSGLNLRVIGGLTTYSPSRCLLNTDPAWKSKPPCPLFSLIDSTSSVVEAIVTLPTGTSAAQWTLSVGRVALAFHSNSPSKSLGRKSVMKPLGYGGLDHPHLDLSADRAFHLRWLLSASLGYGVLRRGR